MGRDLTELTRIIRRIEAKSRIRPPAGPPRSLEGLLDGASQQIFDRAAPAKRGAGPALGLETANDLAEIGGSVAHAAGQSVSGDERAA